jgi:hypothetical protein
MDSQGLLDGFVQISDFIDEGISISNDLMRMKDELRAEVNNISTIRKVEDVKYLSVGAIDSSFRKLIEDNWGRKLYAICLSGVGFIPGAPHVSKNYEVITKDYALSYKDEDNSERILRGLSMANEIYNAKQWFSNMDLILLDGSAKSYIIAINQAMTVNNLENTESGMKLVSIYKETLETLYEMLYHGKVVFAPKRSDKKIVSEEILIADKVSTPIKSDYAILEYVLEKNEYIVIELGQMPNTQPWSYTLPRKEGVSEEFLSKLFYLLKNLKIIYFKTKTGIVSKFETLTPLSVNTLCDFFVLDGENILTYIIDRNAKETTAMLNKYANLLNLPCKYRL